MGDATGTTELLGLEGFVARAQVFDDAGQQWWIEVETTGEQAWCERCGVRATGHGRRRVKVRDLPIAGVAVVLVWAKRIWRCPGAACGAKTWSEQTGEVAPRAVLTERAREEIARRVGPDEHSVAQVAAAFGVSWHTVMAAVRDHGRPRVAPPQCGARCLPQGW